jgi:hypothetical protein
MEKTPKKQSTTIIIGMGKKNKTDLEKALAYYKVSDKTLVNQATTIGIKVGNMKIKLRDGSVETKKVKPTNEPNSYYANKVMELIVKKWKNDTQQYYGTYNMFYKKYDRKSKKMKDIVVKITAKGTKDSVFLDALAQFNKRVQQYQEDYPENDSYAFAEDPISLIPITLVSGIIVENQRVESSVSGGQRTIGKKGVKRHMKMRDALSFFKISNDNQEWDTKQGKCVFDFLIWKYKDVSGFKKPLGKSREQAEQWLNNLFMGNEPEEENPLKQGVSVQQLERFCEFFSINMYAFDKTDNLIEYYKCKKFVDGNKAGREPLMFIAYDEHFYPVEDKAERKSKQGKAVNGVNYTSTDIEAFASSKKEAVKKEIIAPTEEEFEELKRDKPDYLAVQNKWALDYFKQNEGKLPFPIDARCIYVNEATIERITYDDKIILTKPINPYVKRFYDENTTGFQGENTISVTNHIWDDMYPFKINKAPFLSQPNQQVADALNAEKVKWRTHLGRTNDYYKPEDIKEMLQDGKAIAVDITKCYCDAIYNQREKFIVFKGKEIVEAYDGDPLTLGLYFVETDDMTLFHQSNWYCKAIIDLAEKDMIEYKITRQIRCVDEDWCWEKEIKDDKDVVIDITKLDNNNLFKNWCDSVIELTEQDEDFTLTKDVINSLTGYLGKTFTRVKEVGLAKNLEEVWTDWLVPEVQDNPILDVYITEIKSEGDKVYLYGTEKMTKNLSNGLPMYIQLLDWSNIALYNLGKDVGGEIVYRKTDCIVSIGGKIPESKLEDDVCCYSERFGKYHIEDIEKALHFNYDLLMNSNRKVETPPLEDDWKDYKKFKSSDDWEGIIKTAIEKGGMLVSGRAGTGKSYIIGKGIEAKLLPETSESRLAFTNRASRNINGTTIHKAMAINKDDKTNSKTLEHLKSIPIFIIDEISMINAAIWNKLMVLKQTTKSIFILLGDHRQCPPIEDGKDIEYFTHPYAKRLVNYNRCELTKPQRYDMKLWNWLEHFYEGGYEGDDIKKKKLSIENILYRKNICFTNKTRRKINDLCMEYFKKEKTWLVLEVPDPKVSKCKNEYADKAFIYKGLPVMAVANNKDMKIINTEEFWVKDFSSSDSSMTLYRDEDPDEGNREVFVVEFKDFHKYFVVNYAATTHKSQGATITKEINIFDWVYMTEDRRIGYTAVSRGKTCKQVTICSKIV